MVARSGRAGASRVAIAVALLVLAALLAARADAAPRCFGAASRDPQHRCVNPRLARLVEPTPDQALLNPNFSCTPEKISEDLTACRFGAAAAHARATVALIGDSHAQHWRSALAVVTRRHAIGQLFHALVKVGRRTIGRDRVVGRQPMVRKHAQAFAGGPLLGRDHVATANGRGHRGQVVEEICFFERHVAAQPGRGAHANVCVKVAHRTRTRPPLPGCRVCR